MPPYHQKIPHNALLPECPPVCMEGFLAIRKNPPDFLEDLLVMKVSGRRENEMRGVPPEVELSRIISREDREDAPVQNVLLIWGARLRVGGLGLKV